jgi:hypothetical protein
MSKVSIEWVREQLDKGKITVGTGTAVLRLMESWNEIDPDGDHVKEIAEVFSELVQGHVLVEETEGVWVDAVPGQIPKGAIVRVKTDAFQGETGQIHNGRVGKVVDYRYGDVIFRSTDSGRLIDGAHYSPHALQIRVG